MKKEEQSRALTPVGDLVLLPTSQLVRKKSDCSTLSVSGKEFWRVQLTKAMFHFKMYLYFVKGTAR